MKPKIKNNKNWEKQKKTYVKINFEKALDTEYFFYNDEIL